MIPNSWNKLQRLVQDAATTLVDLDKGLVAHISLAAAGVDELAATFENVRKSSHQQYQAFVTIGEHNFEQLL